MQPPILGSFSSHPTYAFHNQDRRKAEIQWVQNLATWKLALTLTMSRTKHDIPPSRDETLRRCRLLLNRVNRVCYGSHGTRRKGFRIASVAFMGYGAYGDHPHVHWLLAGPTDLPPEEFAALLRSIVTTTGGLGEQFDIQPYYGVRWIVYMLDHGFEGWIEQLSFAAKCPPAH